VLSFETVFCFRLDKPILRMRKLRYLLLAVVAFVSSALWLSAQRLSGSFLGSARRLLSRAQDAFTPKRFLPVATVPKNSVLPQNRSHFRAIERIHSLQAGMERSNAYNPYCEWQLARVARKSDASLGPLPCLPLPISSHPQSSTFCFPQMGGTPP